MKEINFIDSKNMQYKIAKYDFVYDDQTPPHLKYEWFISVKDHSFGTYFYLAEDGLHTEYYKAMDYSEVINYMNRILKLKGFL
jgi:hypothetical protein